MEIQMGGVHKQIMSETIIIFGCMGAGKTTYAKKLAEESGFEYLCFDDMFSKMFSNDFDSFYNYFIIKTHNKNIVLDGWFSWEESKIHSVEKLEKCMDIKWVYFFIPKWLAKERHENREKKDVDLGIDTSWERTQDGLRHIKEMTIIDGSDFEYQEYGKEKLNELNREVMPKDVLKAIGNQERYQNIYLSGRITTDGYHDCESSWNQIRPLLDWNGKSVLETGCHWGYFCFEIKKEYAKNVVGTDISEETLEVARTIRNLKRLDTASSQETIPCSEKNI
jgi:ribosomal protein L11 methylase PrmA